MVFKFRPNPDETINDSPAIVDEREKLLRNEEYALEVDLVEPVQFILGCLTELWCDVNGIVDEVAKALGSQNLPAPSGRFG